MLLLSTSHAADWRTSAAPHLAWKEQEEYSEEGWRDRAGRCMRVERDSNTVFLDLGMLFVEVIHRGAGSDNFHFFTHKVH